MSFLAVEDRDGLAVVTLNRSPANALNAAVIEELSRAFAQGAGAGAVVLTSSLPTIFSAGWDLLEVLALDRKGMEDFLERFCDLVRQIFLFGPPVVAVMPGHAIAGGLIVAAAADERWAAGEKSQLGLSEVALGVPIPECCLEIFRHVIGARAMERLAATGENLSVHASRAIGLVDQVVEAKDLLDRGLERARFLASRPAAAYTAIKRRVRASAVARFDQARRGDPFLDFWFGEDARERIRALVEKLKKK
jgi:enoyl-CoA hydratase